MPVNQELVLRALPNLVTCHDCVTYVITGKSLVEMTEEHMTPGQSLRFISDVSDSLEKKCTVIVGIIQIFNPANKLRTSSTRVVIALRLVAPDVPTTRSNIVVRVKFQLGDLGDVQYQSSPPIVTPRSNEPVLGP